MFSLFHQVQNMTQSIQTLDERTQKDLQYVHRMEVQLRGLETKFKQVEENHKQNIAKQYKVWQEYAFTHPFFRFIDLISVAWQPPAF